jgi:hypothetical protein
MVGRECIQMHVCYTLRMGPVLKKMNLKDQTPVVVLDAPTSFEAELESLTDRSVVSERDAVEECSDIGFAVAFVMTQSAVDGAARLLAPRLGDDPLLWFAYPKQSSKRYTCEFNRDTGWAVLGKFGFEPVRQVAVDEDWSALRFRRVDRIKTITRRSSMAVTEDAKRRTTGS